MSVKRFVGSNSRDAMRQVRAALGDDALILSNRRSDDGVEILAMADDEHGRLTQPQGAGGMPDEPTAALAMPAAAPGAMDFAALSERLLGEMQDMRSLLSRQPTTEAMPGHDAVARLRQRLWSIGVGPRLAAELLATLPAELERPEIDDAALTAWLRRQLEARLPVPQGDSEMIDDGGVVALVGPTGVGKTTTTAKLAARYVMRHGNEGVALVTTDSYRIGAHEQLRIYARLLGVEVHALEAEASLTSLLERLAGKRLVIIDTVGMSQRDQRLVSQVARLGESGRRVRLLLLLNAASHGDTLEDVVTTFARAAQTAADNRLVDCILTKSDEAARLGPLLDTVIRHGLRLHYVSNGQQVPEDLRIADAAALVEQALNVSDDSPFAPAEDALRQAPRERGGLQGLSRGLLGQGRSLTSALTTLRRQITGFSLLEQAWELADLARERQSSAYTALSEHAAELARAQADHDPGLSVLWGGQKVGGCDGPAPMQLLDRQGRLLGLSWQYHQLGAGQEQRLGWAGDRLGVERHLFTQCPDMSALEWLSAWRLPWLAAAKGNRRAVHLGERLELSRLAEFAQEVPSFVCRLRGRQVEARLSRLMVEIPAPRNAGLSQPGEAWFCRLADVDEGKTLGQRYWLASAGDDAITRQLIQAELAHADLPLLTRQAWQRLNDAGLADTDRALRLGLAAGLAGVALRLDQEEASWAMDVRAQLLGLLGSRAQRKPKALLEAMLHLFAARDVFRQMGHRGDGLMGN